MNSGDFWCKEHSVWNCMCYLLPGAITTSGGGIPQKHAQEPRVESVLHLGEENYVTCEDDVVTIRCKSGKAVVRMEYETWKKKFGGKEL